MPLQAPHAKAAGRADTCSRPPLGGHHAIDPDLGLRFVAVHSDRSHHPLSGWWLPAATLPEPRVVYVGKAPAGASPQQRTPLST